MPDVTGNRSIRAQVDDLLKKLDAIAEEAPVATAAGLYDGMQDIMVDAKANTPISEDGSHGFEAGALRKTGFVSAPSIMGGKVDIVAGFGAGETKADRGFYAAAVHEREANHPRGGEHKYFQNAIDRGRDRLVAKVAASVRAFLRTGKVRFPDKRVPQTPTEDQ
jgi:hypothetical protein